MKQLKIIKTIAILTFSAFLTSSCASMLNSERQTVNFSAPKEQTVELQTPDGDFTVRNGRGTFQITKSKEDIPVQVTCGGQTQQGVLQTRFDVLTGGVLNVLMWGVGALVAIPIDASSGKSYDIQKNVNLTPYCPKQEVTSLMNSP